MTLHDPSFDAEARLGTKARVAAALGMNPAVLTKRLHLLEKHGFPKKKE